MGEVDFVEGCINGKLRVVETYIFELDDPMRNILSPVFPQSFNHPAGEPMQGDIHDMPALTFEPGSHAAEFVMLLEQQHAVAIAGDHVGRGEASQSAADDDDVVSVFCVFEKVFGHWGREVRGQRSEVRDLVAAMLRIAGKLPMKCSISSKL